MSPSRFTSSQLTQLLMAVVWSNELGSTAATGAPVVDGRVVAANIISSPETESARRRRIDEASETVLSDAYEDGGAAEISYVMEPFEYMSNEEWFTRIYDDNCTLDLSTASTSGALFGESALRVQYEAKHTDDKESGKIVDFGSILSKSEASHNCHGASYMSLFYKVNFEPSLDERLQLRLVLLDDSDCIDEQDGANCFDAPGKNIENYYHTFFGLSPHTDWRELRVDLKNSSVWQRDPTGQVGNEELDLEHLRGWRIELSADSKAGPPPTASAAASGAILIDQVACVGGGEILEAAFHVGDTFSGAVASGAWFEEYYQSALSQERTSTVLSGGILSLNYTIEQSESWGGFLDYRHICPGPAYYNLSQATAVSLGYNVLEAASVAGRAHLRVILLDGSHCDEACSSYPGSNLEHYYSFHYVLDDDATDSSSGNLAVALEGNSDSTSPFWQTGWAGAVGNKVLDASIVKGFSFELNVDSQGDIGSLVSGSVMLGNFSAISDEARSDPGGGCIKEPNLLFKEDSSVFKRKEFLGSKCCETCGADPDCVYAHSNGQDCFMASYLDASAVGLHSTEYMESNFAAFWMDDAMKRGEFCKLCECREVDAIIDCRDKDLSVVPKTFSPGETSLTEAPPIWMPRVLDLRGNPRLVLLGSGVLSSVAEDLEVIRTPVNLQHLSLEGIQDLPALAVVSFEGEPDEGAMATPHNDIGTMVGPSAQQASSNSLNNVIAGSSDFYGDVCCGRGAHVNLSLPVSGLTFCDMEVDMPGSDARYEPFIQYIEAAVVKVLRPSSSFMAEAAESPEKCAEYCAITDSCNYFSYDARHKESEAKCYLLANNGTRHEKVCCDPDDFADLGGTIPGWTSGLPPRTRNEIDNAAVLSTPQNLVANKENGYKTHYTISLGNTPLRGAVWVEPKLAASAAGLGITIDPQRVALYDASTIATINVDVANVDALSTGHTLVVNNYIEACDTAFTAATGMVSTEENAVYIHVEASNEYKVILLAVLLTFTLVTAIVIYFYVQHKKRQAISAWKVLASELYFNDPPIIVGRGTFGMVLLAEYRGTNVAVKRVIPPRSSKRTERLTTLFGWGEGQDSMTSSAFDISKGSARRSTGDSSAQGENDGDDAQGQPSGAATDVESGVKSRMLNAQNPGGCFALHSKASLTLRSGGMSFRKRFEYRGEYSRLKADFIAEMRHISKLRHPCITTVMGAVIAKKEEPMLIMEYMDHGSLSDLLHNDTMMIEGELLLPILRDIAQGVRFLHAAKPKVIHGDLKAQNVLVDSKFRAKVADFGLSMKKQIGATGTAFWMAPELLRGESENTAASDVYSFGIILYELYSRRDPYDGEDAQEVLKLVADPSISKRPPIPPSCPSQVQSLMTECLFDDPEDRPTFEELDVRLKRLDVATVEPAGEMRFSMQTKKEYRAHHRTNELLFEVFPQHIAEALRDGRKVEPESRDLVTIFFSDIVGFTNISATLTPIKVSDMLDRLYNEFDDLSRQHDVFKVETIGDAYMAVTGLIKDQPDHAKRIAEFSVGALEAAGQTLIDLDDPEKGYVKIRIGFHSGPVVANVVGSRNPRYCLFGDTVNTASRMESNSKDSRIHCSERSAKLLRRQFPEMRIRSRGRIHVKGKGDMSTYWVNEEPQHRKSSAVSFASSVNTEHMLDRDVCPEEPPSPTCTRGAKSLRRLSLPSFRLASASSRWSVSHKNVPDEEPSPLQSGNTLEIDVTGEELPLPNQASRRDGAPQPVTQERRFSLEQLRSPQPATQRRRFSLEQLRSSLSSSFA